MPNFSLNQNSFAIDMFIINKFFNYFSEVKLKTILLSGIIFILKFYEIS